MGSPISGIIAEIFLQWYENLNIKNHMDNKSVILYTRYVDDILIIYDSTKITNQQIIQQANTIHPDLIFDHTMECDKSNNFLDVTIHHNNTTFDINIYRKPTTTDTTIHFNTNHPFEQKTAAFRFLQNRMHQLPLNQQQKQEECANITHIAKSNGYPISIINKINTRIINKTHTPLMIEQQHKKRITFT
jgi:hypothetical protein